MNLAFLSAISVLCVAAAGFVLFPLLRSSGQNRQQRSRREVNAAIYRDRLRELDYDVEQGTLTRDQYGAAVADLQKELVQSGAVDPDQPVQQPAGAQRPLLIVSGAVAALGVPLLAIGIYSSVGFAGLVMQGGPQVAEGGPAGGSAMPASPHDTAAFEELVEQVRARLAANPEDRRGWVLLARTLVFLERFDEASDAFSHAVALGGDRDPDLLVQYADVLGAANGGLQGRPRELIDKALELAPDHPQGLWLAGSAAYYEADYANARRYWERLLAVLPPDSEGASIIRTNLDEIRMLSGEG